MKLQRTAGFTIIELTIAMLLSAIIIGITYTLWMLIVRSHHAFVEKNDELALAQRLDEVIRKDLGRSDLALKDTGGIVLISGKQTIRYYFDTAFVVRKSLRTDSFKIRVDSLGASFEDRPVLKVSLLPDSSRIDRLDLSLFVQHRQITYHYHKLYSSADLIQNSPDADH